MVDKKLQTKIISSAREVFERSPVFLAYVFGSCVFGDPHPKSDLDIGYYMGDNDAKTVMSMKDELILAAELSDRIGMDIDLRNLAHAPLELRGRVLEEGIRIYCSDHIRRVNLEGMLLGQYHDYKEEFNQMHELRLQQLAARGF